MTRLILACVAALAASPLRAEPGATGAVTLARPLGARATAMADAFSAVAGGLDSLTFNPAGLSGQEIREVRTDYTRGIVDDSFSFLGYAQPLSRAVLATGAAYYDAGTITLNLSNGTHDKVKVQQDWIGLLGGAVDLGAGLSVGAVAKYYRLTLGQAASASGGALDAGALWRTPLRGLNFGASAQNAGPNVKFEQEGDPLPLTLRAGAALEIAGPPPNDPAAIRFNHFLLTADVIKPRDDRPAAATGAEMRMSLGRASHGALRVGYVFNRDIDSLSLGIGLREGRFVFDYALGVKKSLSNAHHFSLGIRF
jgi:hypothetical protein